MLNKFCAGSDCFIPRQGPGSSSSCSPSAFSPGSSVPAKAAAGAALDSFSCVETPCCAAACPRSCVPASVAAAASGDLCSCTLVARSIDNPKTAARFIVYLLLNFPCTDIHICVTNTNIVIGNREPSSGSITIILTGCQPRCLLPLLLLLLLHVLSAAGPHNTVLAHRRTEKSPLPHCLLSPCVWGLIPLGPT